MLCLGRRQDAAVTALGRSPWLDTGWQDSSPWQVPAQPWRRSSSFWVLILLANRQRQWFPDFSVGPPKYNLGLDLFLSFSLASNPGLRKLVGVPTCEPPPPLAFILLALPTLGKVYLLTLNTVSVSTSQIELRLRDRKSQHPEPTPGLSSSPTLPSYSDLLLRSHSIGLATDYTAPCLSSSKL
jgi:hypothetical protein